ncbi:MAG: ATP-binding cassette domain-containing protein [Planctomycetaceae bacterium]|jgi:ABC-type lipoprotein export system ATPase subunit|nr:ATP-binding cassette domain-containing protein [Planctomycetaceae bacterium]
MKRRRQKHKYKQRQPAKPMIAKPVFQMDLLPSMNTILKTDISIVLEVDGLEHQLYDPENGDTFTLCIDRPLVFRAGSFTTILGPSGCGKTTLLTLLGLLRKPSSPKTIKKFCIYGDVKYDLADLWQRGYERHIEKLRRQFIGFALQSGELLSSLTVSENIAFPLRLNGVSGTQSNKRVKELLEAFDLSSQVKGSRLANARVNKLSGGEFQRVVLARAIAHSPRIVFVDEPTSALNRELARKALLQLKTLQSDKANKTAVVMITHDEMLSEEFSDQIIRMMPETKRAAGRIVEIINKCINHT